MRGGSIMNIKLSKYIEKLNKILKDNGDIDCIYSSDNVSPHFLG